MRRGGAGLSVLVLAFVQGACSTDGGSGAGEEVASGGTIGVATLPPVATTVAPAPASTTTVPDATVAPATDASAPTAPAAPGPTIRASTTTAPPVTTPPTTAAASPPCRLDQIVEQTQTGYDGITPSDLNCAEGWAAWIGRPGDELSDGFFAIARWTGASWELQNLGTAGVCADAGVPDDLWNRLGCFE